MEVLTDAADPSAFLLFTRWTDQESFQNWHASEAHHPPDGLLIHGVELDTSFTSVTIGNSIELHGAPQGRHDATFQAHTRQLSDRISAMTCEAERASRELREARETVERLARTDDLTGLANRRTLHLALKRELARAERLGGRLSVILAGLDHLKSINAQHGHSTGDCVLASAAGIFGKQLRPYDLAARYGDEKFVLLLPGASVEHAIAIAERIRREIARLTVPGCPREITVSVGVAGWITGDSPENFIARADAALHLARSNGRNRIEAAVALRA